MLRTSSGLSNLTLILIGGIALLNTGCGDNNIVADSTVKSGTYYADTGITGDANIVTIERGSRLSKLSIIGDGNEVMVENGVRLPRVEIFGSDNTISVPGDMLVQMNEVGHRNQLIRRELPKVEDQPVLYETTRTRPVDVTIYQQRETVNPQGNVTATSTYETSYRSSSDPAGNPQSTIQELRRMSPPEEDLEPTKDATETYYDKDPVAQPEPMKDPGVVETQYEPMKDPVAEESEPTKDDDYSPLK